MRALTTALATTALVATCGLVISPMHTAAAADGNPFDGPVGGERLGSGPAVVTAGGPTPPAVRAAAWLVADFDTTVTDPTGLDADGQLSSAYDLALIARAGLKRKDFSRYASTKIAYYPQSTTGTYQISNQNHLLWSYPGALGVKTGYTTLARNTFVGAASRDGHRLVVTLLNAPHGVSKDAAALLDWAFANRTALSGVGTLVTPADVARARDPHPAASPAPTAVPRTAPASGSKTGLTAGGPLRIAQTTLAKVPLWAYGIPPLLLVMSWFRPKPKARRARASAGTGGRPVARRRRH